MANFLRNAPGDRPVPAVLIYKGGLALYRPNEEIFMPLEPMPPPGAARDAKRVLRLARTGALATLEGGAPLTTLVGVASDWDGSPLFLMSELSRHSRNLVADARASLLLTSEGRRGDPLNQPRLTLSGTVALHPDPSSRARYLKRNPKAKLYADFGDFAVRRLRVEALHFNGGFGRADRLAVDDLLTPSDGAADLAAAEDALLAEVAALGADEISRLAAGAAPGRRAWRPVGLDAEGLDLASGRAAARVDFLSPAQDAASWRAALKTRRGA